MELVMTIIFTVIGACISVLLAAISYFLKEFKQSVDNVCVSVNKLEITAATYSEKFATNDKNTEAINVCLNKHGEKLEDHEKRLYKLEN